jgi:BirA family transcriptional regulator, biotin operon repressor / biotin---[acetyl-CoA-carboxylase] ligase
MDFQIKHLDRIGSTNEYALELLQKASIEEGLVIWADQQINGVGHGNNRWESESGKNLTFSLVLCPLKLNPADQFLLTQMVSVAIHDLILEYIPSEAVKIKWPNDIYIAHDKVAGILIRNVLSGNNIRYSIIGIGLNVNQESFNSDAPNPVSLIHYLGTSLVLEDILSKLLIRINGIYAGLDSKEYVEELNKSYIENLYRYRQEARYREGKREFMATIEGIGEYGKLKLKLKKGTSVLYDFKEVEFVP